MDSSLRWRREREDNDHAKEKEREVVGTKTALGADWEKLGGGMLYHDIRSYLQKKLITILEMIGYIQNRHIRIIK